MNDNIIYIIKKFKEKINPNYAPSKEDIDNLVKYVNGEVYFSDITKDGKYKDFDYDLLKKNNVKDFSFIPNYLNMCKTELEELKEKHYSSRG